MYATASMLRQSSHAADFEVNAASGYMEARAAVAHRFDCSVS